MKKNPTIRFVFFMAFFALISGAYAQKAGIDLSQLKQRLGSARDGDTIYIKPGYYSNVATTLTGRFRKGVVIKSVNGALTLTGRSSFAFINSSNISLQGVFFRQTTGVTILISGSDHIEITNNHFYKCGTLASNSIIRILNGSAANRISFNTFDDSRAQQIAIITAEKNDNDKNNTDNVITRNYFCNTQSVKALYPSSNGNGMEALMIGYATDKTMVYNLRTIVSENLFENIVGDSAEIISNKTSGNVIKGNMFLNNKSGLSLRAGNNVQVVDNYFDNTDKGIRIFGSGHVIKNNYLVNCDVGIQMPTSDFAEGTHSTRTGYFQQNNITIQSNFIINPKVSDIVMDGGRRALHPKNVSVDNNDILYKDKGRLLNASKSLAFKSLSNNRYTAYDSGNSALTSRLDVWRSKLDDADKGLPFKSADRNVGAKWKKDTGEF